MVLEYSKVRDKQYFNEFLNVSLFANKIRKNPAEKVKGIISVLHKYIYVAIILTAFFAAIFFVGVGPVKYIGAAGGVISLVGLVFGLSMLLSFSMRITEFASVIEPQTLSIDDSSVKYEYKDGAVEIKKKDLACIVINKHSICFLPQEEGAPIIGTGIEYKEKILSNKDKLGYASLITDNSALYEPKGKNETKSSKGNKGDKK